MSNNIGKISPRLITEEMQESYLDYAMSVIVSRALPDVRDGLKPVHRRILYAMWNIGLRPGSKYRKSANVVGEVLGKYHPHGDLAVYDSMVRMAQTFSLRYTLVDGQGNFGSIDGDSAAAHRYTEARLAKISEELLTDIEKNTVNFVPNYDGSQQEPVVLPARLPNLLLNGTMGIAVGMATNIPPHNLGEVIDGVIHLVDNPNASVEDLLNFIKGPDFPTGAQIFDINEIKQAYATGKGSIVMKAKADIVEEKTDQFRIIVSEIPYQVNKSVLIENIAHLVHDKKIDGIRDLRDESGKDGIRIVIDLKKDAYPKKTLNRLFKLTQLQDTFHVNMLALVDGIQPRVLTLKMVLEEYLKHQQEVTRRQLTYDLERAKERAHILEGLAIALKRLDPVIRTIKQSKDKDQAKVNLMKKFKLTEIQSIAILEMKLQQLANMEQKKILDELKEKLLFIKEMKALLASPKRILGVIKKQLLDIKNKYADERKTQVFPNPVDKFTQEDLIPNEPTIVMTTRDGYIKRVEPTAFKTQGRGGKGVIGLTTKEEDMVEHFFGTTTHADLLFFTTKGRVFQLKTYDIPQTGRTAKGQAIVNFLQLPGDEKISVVLPLSEILDYKYLIMVTRNGIIKKVSLDDFKKVRRSGLIALRLKPGDLLEWVKPTTGKDNIILVSQDGKAIHFKEKDVRSMGRGAAGVRGIKLKKDDRVCGMGIVPHGSISPQEQLLVVMENGHGKRTSLRSYKVQHRGGTGIKTANITPKTGKIIQSFIVTSKREKEDMVVISSKGQVIRLPLKSVSVLGRATQGVRLMRFSEKSDKVASVTFV
ncbi:DNA gyrase subunit A [Patescibacteria group bacterium]|nr:DNA gyrase subunit A [Patescibacteria group bacterium]MBU1890500.1 DNA gyrase subunit A [Patescibacteria group bacterium]